MKITTAAPDAPRPAPIPDRLPWRDGAIVGLAWAVLVGGLAGLASLILALLVAWLAGALWALIVGGVGLLLSLAAGAGVGVWHGAFAIIGWTQDHVSLRLYPATPVMVQEPDPAPATPSRIHVEVFHRKDNGDTARIQWCDWDADMVTLARELLLNGKPFTVRGLAGVLSEDKIKALRDELIDRELAVWKVPNSPLQGVELTSTGRQVLLALLPSPTAPDDTKPA